MKPLERELRNELERTVKEARDNAEAAARIALKQFGVQEATPSAHLSESDRSLRRKSATTCSSNRRLTRFWRN